MVERSIKDKSTGRGKVGSAERPPPRPLTNEMVCARLDHLHRMMDLALQKLADLDARVARLAGDADEDDAISKECGEAMKLYFATL